MKCMKNLIGTRNDVTYTAGDTKTCIYTVNDHNVVVINYSIS